MKKQHLFIILSVILLGFVFGIIQYYQALKTEDVSAVTVGIPNPGHSLAQLECSADSLCVDTTNNRVGIGTANPISKLQVVGDNIRVGYGYGIQFHGTVASTGTFLLHSTPATAGIRLALAYDSGTQRPFEIGYYTNDDIANTWNSRFYVNGYSGKVGIGTTNPLELLQVKGTIAIANANEIAAKLVPFIGDTSDNGGGLNIQIRNGNSQLFENVMTLLEPQGSSSKYVGIGTTSPGYTLTVAGTAWVTSGSWSGSDIRWKKNIETMSQSSSLDKVIALNPVTYQWKTDEYPEMKFSTGTQLGFIAQDVEKIIPEVVTTNNEGYKGISYEKIVPVLTSAIQEQEKKIEQLKAIVCLDHPLAEVCK